MSKIFRKLAKMHEVSDLEVWRAANQLIRQFQDPEFEAAQRADAAYEAGDMFNFNLWTRINGAIAQLLRVPPAGPHN